MVIFFIYTERNIGRKSPFSGHCRGMVLIYGGIQSRQERWREIRDVPKDSTDLRFRASSLLSDTKGRPRKTQGHDSIPQILQHAATPVQSNNKQNITL